MFLSTQKKKNLILVELNLLDLFLVCNYPGEKILQ